MLWRVGVIAGEYFWCRRIAKRMSTILERLAALVASMNAVADRWGMPVPVSNPPAHPRLALEADDALAPHQLVRFHPPFGFLDTTSCNCVGVRPVRFGDHR